MVPQFFNIILSMWSILLIHKTAKMMGINYRLRKLLMLLLCFLPNFLLIPSLLLQESIIILGVSGSIYLYTKWWHKDNYVYLILAIAISFFAGFLHVGGTVCAFGMGTTLFAINNPERKIKMTKNIFISCILVFTLMIVFMSSSNILFRKVGGELSTDNIIERAGATDRVSSAEYGEIGISGLPAGVGFGVNSILRALYFVCSPLPWMWRGMADVLAFWGSALFFMIVIYQGAKTIWQFRKSNQSYWLRNYLYVLSACVLIAIIVFGWGVSNTGTALRHREKYTCLFALLYVVSKQVQINSTSGDPSKTEGFHLSP